MKKNVFQDESIFGDRSIYDLLSGLIDAGRLAASRIRLGPRFGGDPDMDSDFPMLGRPRWRMPTDDDEYERMNWPTTVRTNDPRRNRLISPPEGSRSPSSSSSSSSSSEEEVPDIPPYLGSSSILTSGIRRAIELVFPVYVLADSLTANYIISFTTDNTSYDVCYPLVYQILDVPTPFNSGYSSMEYRRMTTLYRNVKIHNIMYTFVRDLMDLNSTVQNLPDLSISITPDKPIRYNNKVIEWSFDNFDSDGNAYYQMENHDKFSDISVRSIPNSIIDTSNSSLGDWQNTNTLNTLDLSINLGYKTYPKFGPANLSTRVGCVTVILDTEFSNPQSSL